MDEVHVNISGHNYKSGSRIYDTKLWLILFWIQHGRVSEREASSFDTPEVTGVQLWRGHSDVGKPLLTAYDLRRIEASKCAVRIFVRGEVLELVGVLVVSIAKADDAVLYQPSNLQFLQK